jgi:hypothetical protein
MRKVSGYVMNEYGAPMKNVQLLVQALDENNKVVGQKLVWLGGVLSGFDRRYFEVTGLPPAKDYRVSVWAYDRIESPSWP